MKIQLISDLHLESPAAEIDPVNAGSDVLILGGDICTGSTAAENRAFFELCSQRWKHVIYLMGNHEHYHGDFPETLKTLRAALDGIPNLHILEKESIELDGVHFWGATLWTDCNGRDPRTITTLDRGMNDYRIVQNGAHRFRAQDALTDHEIATRELSRFLDDHVSEKIVICTHHAPSKKSLHPRYENDFHMNGGYSSDLTWFMAGNHNIALWTHGHTHDSFDYMEHSTRVVANPAGYQWSRGQLENARFNMAKVIEI